VLREASAAAMLLLCVRIARALRCCCCGVLQTAGTQGLCGEQLKVTSRRFNVECAAAAGVMQPRSGVLSTSTAALAQPRGGGDCGCEEVSVQDSLYVVMSTVLDTPGW
jgi:hypothetical protein